MCPQVLKLLGYLLSSKQHLQLTILETPAPLANKTESLGPVCENWGELDSTDISLLPWQDGTQKCTEDNQAAAVR